MNYFYFQILRKYTWSHLNSSNTIYIDYFINMKMSALDQGRICETNFWFHPTLIYTSVTIYKYKKKKDNLAK